jgi:hypothetical protein
MHFLSIDLARWDTAAGGSPGGSIGEALVLSYFDDERPLRGAAGLADWRLCGRLSRLLASGKLSGAAGETMMLPPAGRRLPCSRLVLFGLGKQAGFDEARYRRELRRMRDVLGRAGLKQLAIQPPGRATGLIAARRAFEILNEEWPDGADVTILESPSGQKEMAEALRARK